MKNLLLNTRRFLLISCLLGLTGLTRCSTDKHAMGAAARGTGSEKVSPNNAPDQRAIDSIKQIETNRKQYDSTATEK